MTFHIHICNVGRTPDSIYKVFTSDIPIDRMYLLNSRAIEGSGDDHFDYYEMEKQMIDHMAGINFTDVRTVVINPFDYHDVYNAVLGIEAEEKNSCQNVKFHINFTLGTNVMAGAVCSAAYTIDADLYYVKSAKYILGSEGVDDLIPISIANYSVVNVLERQKKTASVLMAINGGICSNADLITKFGIKPNTLSHHTDLLRSYGLIKNDGSSRNITWSITEKGGEVIKKLI